MKTTVKESTTVVPSKETPKHRIWNSNLDLLVPRVHIRTVYFYKPNANGIGGSNFFDPKVLKEALANVLVPFYPVAGRLGKDENGRYEINCNGEGVLFVEAETESAIDEFGDFTPCMEYQHLIPTVDYSHHCSSYPLLLLQVTSFKCGGICLGVGFHHTLVDGKSALHFINTWSDVARGLSINIPPFIDRTLVRARDPPTPTYHHIEYDAPPSMITPTQTTESQSDPKPTSTSVLTITPDQVATLKAVAKKDNPTVRYSSYETLAAHIWRCACIARGLPDDQPSKLFVATDGRSRLNPPLPPGYFGNVLFTATSIATAGELKSTPLTDTVGKIHEAALRMGDDYLLSALDFLEVQPDPTAFIRGAHTFKCPNLNVVSWIRLPIHDCDFGWGRPIYMGPASVIFEGMAYILPSPVRDGNLSLAICLETSHMQVFKKVFYL